MSKEKEYDQTLHNENRSDCPIDEKIVSYQSFIDDDRVSVEEIKKPLRAMKIDELRGLVVSLLSYSKMNQNSS